MKITTLTAILLATFFSHQISAEDYSIEAKGPTTRGQRVEVQLEIRGTLIVDSNLDDEIRGEELPLEVDGQFEYRERQLRSQTSTRLIRHYDLARAEIDFGSGPAISELSPENRWLITDRKLEGDSRRIRYLAAGDGLTQKELELLNIPANTAIWDAILQAAKQSIGDSWEPAADNLADALAVDQIRESTIACRLLSVRDGVAEIEVRGAAQALVEDAQAELEVQGRCLFDLTAGHSRQVQLTIREARQISGSAPGFDTITKLTVQVERPATDVLSSDEIAAQELDKQRWSDYLRFVSEDGQVRLRHERRWRMIRSTAEVSIFRLIDGGVLLGQINIEPRPRLPSPDAYTLAAFQKEVAEKTAESGKVAKADQWKSERGLDVMCVTVQGREAELNVTWMYYHIAQPDGQRVSAIVTFDTEVQDEIAGADRKFLESISLAPATQAQSGKTTR